MFNWIKRLFGRTAELKPRLTFESASGFKFYTSMVRLHNENHPAVITPEGTKIWYLYGKIGRRDGASVETVEGSRYWFDGHDLHRVDGPAIEHISGVKIFYLEGRELTVEEWLKRTPVSTEKKVEMALIYS